MDTRIRCSRCARSLVCTNSMNVTDLADLKMCKDVETVFLHMCAFNLTARDEFGKGLVEGQGQERGKLSGRMSCAVQSWTQFTCTLTESTSKVFHIVVKKKTLNFSRQSPTCVNLTMWCLFYI